MQLRTIGTGRVHIGDRVEIGGGTQIVAMHDAEVRIGSDTFVAGLCIIAAAENISIGEQCMLAEMVCIRDHDHDPDAPPRSGAMLRRPMQIGARVWIASKASVIRGGGVGHDTVIGAHALVNRLIPANVLAAGVPARVIRSRSGTTP